MISVLSSSQWSSFFRHDTIFSDARSISDMCLSFIWIFQSISCRNMYVFSILPFMFLCYLTYINLLLSTFVSYHILFHALHLYLLHKLTAVYHTCTYTIMYCVCHLHEIYISDIYISINFYCAIHFTSCPYCHPKNHTQVHHWYMSSNESIWHMFCYIVFVFGNLHT